MIQVIDEVTMSSSICQSIECCYRSFLTSQLRLLLKFMIPYLNLWQLPQILRKELRSEYLLDDLACARFGKLSVHNS